MKILILSDIHANWPALLSIISQEKKFDAVMCLGDLVNYGPHPRACVEWARANIRENWCVQGNHDRAIGLDENPRCLEAFRPLAADMQHFTVGQLDDDQKGTLQNCPFWSNAQSVERSLYPGSKQTLYPLIEKSFLRPPDGALLGIVPGDWSSTDRIIVVDARGCPRAIVNARKSSQKPPSDQAAEAA